MDIDDHDLIDIGSNGAMEAARKAAEEEEAYRIKALDYALGHVAAKVKENENYHPSTAAPTSNVNNSKHCNHNNQSNNTNTTKNNSQIQSMNGSLMAAMLQSAHSRPNQKITSTQTDSLQSREAKHEFDQLVTQEMANNKQDIMEMGKDSDEEENVTMLQTEFQSIIPTTTTTSSYNEGKEKDMTKMTAIWSAWHYFPSSSNDSSTRQTTTSTRRDEMQLKIDELEWNIEELEKSLRDPTCTRNFDDIQQELSLLKKDLARAKREKRMKRLRNILPF
mmetsp:Transcript_770/g.1213  ORF Transcript_770/g.1213 Transcript_770/m.1213 type:complete len:277 (-) Transcript_770:140-970(-)